MENMFMLMGIFMKENGKMTNRMGRVFLYKPVEENMMEVGKMICSKV